jgi:hypothetical protein
MRKINWNPKEQIVEPEVPTPVPPPPVQTNPTPSSVIQRVKKRKIKQATQPTEALSEARRINQTDLWDHFVGVGPLSTTPTFKAFAKRRSYCSA